MQTHTLAAYAAIAALSIVSPGPSILLSLRNGASFGARSVLWSAFGNISGVFCLSAAAILGLGVLLKSSAILFAVVKVLGALYLFYIGANQLFSKTSAIAYESDADATSTPPVPRKLYMEAFFTAVTNPKAVLFFTALFPQFVSSQDPLAPQFFTLTGIFMALSYTTHLSYALLASRARNLLLKPLFAKWMNRIVGSVFIGFGTLLLALRRPAV